MTRSGGTDDMGLSQRAELLAQPEPGHRFFEILGNLWNPESNPEGYVNLGVAENSLMHTEMVSKINSDFQISESNLTYGDNQKHLKDVLANFLTRHKHPFTPVQPHHISVVNGCTTALQNLSWALANPGDIILVGRPFYGGIPMDISRRTEVQLVPIDTEDGDPLGEDAIAKFENEVLRQRNNGSRVRAILLLHPHNPLGRCYPEHVLREYMKLCDRHQLHLISNEIYALSEYDNRTDRNVAARFNSVLSIDPAGLIDPRLVHVVWGMSKDFGANGLRLGVTVTQHNDKLRAALLSVFEFSWTSSLADVATINILSDELWVDWYIEENRRRLSRGHEKLATWAMKHGIEYEPGTNAGFFLWVNLGKKYCEYHDVVNDLNSLVMAALLRDRIFLADGTRFGSRREGWFRIVFAHDEAYVDEGLKRIVRALTVS